MRPNTHTVLFTTAAMIALACLAIPRHPASAAQSAASRPSASPPVATPPAARSSTRDAGYPPASLVADCRDAAPPISAALR